MGLDHFRQAVMIFYESFSLQTLTIKHRFFPGKPCMKIWSESSTSLLSKMNRRRSGKDYVQYCGHKWQLQDDGTIEQRKQKSRKESWSQWTDSLVSVHGNTWLNLEFVREIMLYIYFQMLHIVALAVVATCGNKNYTNRIFKGSSLWFCML